MSSADRRERLLARHKGDVKAADMFDVRTFFPCMLYFKKHVFQTFEKLMEGVQENEPNTIEMKVDSAMTRDEVVAEIIQRVEKLEC